MTSAIDLTTARNADLLTIRAMLEEQRAFNQEQVRINTRLETLMREVFQQRHNGHEA